jgi:undecaprenyl pyrophosphate phosphatase UppP
MTHLTYLEAAVVGLIQGVTELFPVSSLGHNVLIPALIGGSWARDLNVSATESPYLAFIVGLHVATAIALLIYFWRDWVRITKGFFSSLGQIIQPAAGSSRWDLQPDEQLAWLIILATIPVGLAGLAFEHAFRVIFGKPAYAAVFLIINGLILLAGERFRSRASLRADEQIAAEREYALAGAYPSEEQHSRTQERYYRDDGGDRAYSGHYRDDDRYYRDDDRDRGYSGQYRDSDRYYQDDRAPGYGGHYRDQDRYYRDDDRDRGYSGQYRDSDRYYQDDPRDRDYDRYYREETRQHPGEARHASGSRAQRVEEMEDAVASDERLSAMGPLQAVVIGSAQILALLAGISRDGVTMVAGMTRGLSREDSARFAFLLATPVILAAGALKIPDLMGPLGSGIHGQVVVGSILSGVGAYISVRFLTRYFMTRTLTPFGIYCIIAGLGSLVYLQFIK